MRTLLSLVAALCLVGTSPAAAQQGPVEPATFEAWMSELSNWGRWGPDDELGTLNLITPARRLAGAQLVRTGVAISLARELETVPSAHNTSPLGHEMTGTGLNSESFSGDRLSISYHGLAHSHLDALGHVFHAGEMYNGVSQTLVDSLGAERLSIAVMSEGVVSRGVLIDLPRLRGVDYLEPGEAVLSDELDVWSARTGVDVGPGDVVLIRTGRWARLDAEGEWSPFERLAGLHASAASWFKERDVAAVGTDAALDVIPSSVEGVVFPLHKLLIVAMGSPLFDNLDLEALASHAAEERRWEFFFVAAPLRVKGGVGSPLNPLAIF